MQRLTGIGASPGVVAGRRQLMEATGANLEPIFLLYDGDGADGALSRLVAQVAGFRPPLVTVDTDDGVRHRLWGLADPAEHAVVAADLASRQALIADGHHRYAAYLELQARKRAGRPGPGRPRRARRTSDRPGCRACRSPCSGRRGSGC